VPINRETSKKGQTLWQNPVTGNAVPDKNYAGQKLQEHFELSGKTGFVLH